MERDPITFVWDGRVMTPLNRHLAEARRRFVPGTWYPMEVHLEQSDKSRKHYFAVLRKAAETMSESLEKEIGAEGMDAHGKAERLRGWALVEAGVFEDNRVPCETEGELEALVARKMTKAGYRKLMRDGLVLIERVPKSQSPKSMNGTAFEEAKRAVLEVVAIALGIDVAVLSKVVKREPDDAVA